LKMKSFLTWPDSSAGIHAALSLPYLLTSVPSFPHSSPLLLLFPRRRSVGSEEQEAYGEGDYGDPSGFDEQQLQLGEGDLDQEDYRSAFYDEETGEIYEGGYGPLSVAISLSLSFFLLIFPLLSFVSLCHPLCSTVMPSVPLWLSWISGTRHGKGVCLYGDGTLYEGSWVSGREHGYGVWMTGERQIIFSGEWVEGKMQGTGTYYFPNGDIYIGLSPAHLSPPLPSEPFPLLLTVVLVLVSLLCSVVCLCSVGEWREGLRHGKGQYTLKDGTR
jgi:hypothetical protein